jgi:hypothetical protein
MERTEIECRKLRRQLEHVEKKLRVQRDDLLEYHQINNRNRAVILGVEELASANAALAKKADDRYAITEENLSIGYNELELIKVVHDVSVRQADNYKRSFHNMMMNVIEM